MIKSTLWIMGLYLALIVIGCAVVWLWLGH